MIRVGSKRRRGVKGEKNAIMKGFKNIDVTSGSMNIITNPESSVKTYAYTLSPIKGDTYPIVAFDGLIFHNFEMFWQGNKVFEHLGHAKLVKEKWVLTDKFFKWRQKWASVIYAKKNKNKRYLPNTKGFKPLFGYYEDKQLSYIESRNIYLKRYCEKIKDLPVMKALLERMKLGEKFMILDGDGPPLAIYPTGADITTEFVQKMFDNPRYPFGHGYVVAYVLYILYNIGRHNKT